jgi:hypothetical protein
MKLQIVCIIVYLATEFQWRSLVWECFLRSKSSPEFISVSNETSGSGVPGLFARQPRAGGGVSSNLAGHGKPTAPRGWADRIGIFLSGLCLVHCVLTGAILVLLPSLQLFFPHELFHKIFLLVLPLFAIIAFIPGYRRHGSMKIFFWALAGFSLLVLGAFAFEGTLWLETAVSISGSSCLIRAHFLNRHLCSCGHTHVKNHAHVSQP